MNEQKGTSLSLCLLNLQLYHVYLVTCVMLTSFNFYFRWSVNWRTKFKACKKYKRWFVNLSKVGTSCKSWGKALLQRSSYWSIAIRVKLVPWKRSTSPKIRVRTRLPRKRFVCTNFWNIPTLCNVTGVVWRLNGSLYSWNIAVVENFSTELVKLSALLL